MRTEARFPGVRQGAGHYESFYVKAPTPQGGRGVWIRHTVHKRPGEAPSASLWLTLVRRRGDRAASHQGDRRLRRAVGARGHLHPGRRGQLEPGRAVGSIAAPGPRGELGPHLHRLAAEAFHHLPYRRLYDAPLPTHEVPQPPPRALFAGTATVGGETSSAFDGWPGMIGHNWGSEHAERWVWIQARRARAASPTAIWTSPRAGSRSAAGPRPGSPTGCCASTAPSTASAASTRCLSTKIDESPTAARSRSPAPA